MRGGCGRAACGGATGWTEWGRGGASGGASDCPEVCRWREASGGCRDAGRCGYGCEVYCTPPAPLPPLQGVYWGLYWMMEEWGWLLRGAASAACSG